MEGERDESRGEEEAIGVTPRMESQVDPRVIGPLHRSTLNDDAKADRVKEDENEGGRGHSIMDAFVA